MEFKRLGPYQIGRQIGRGGMGTVYAAIEVDTGKQAAVKVLSPALAEREGFRERFEAEIESLKQLEHPNIVKLFGYGRQDDYLFYAMELIDGPTLEDELRAGRRFNWREAAQIGIMLCRALKLAHDHGIVHRDIKPANLLVTRENEVKLSDFGIARLFGNMSLTSEGGVIGTAEYMAPEQADGRRVTHHCDLYSLGCVLYALLAGRPPFKAKSMLEMLHKQRYAEPESVRRFAHDAPQEFDSIILQLLAKEPAERFANALMVGRRLESMERALTRIPQPGPNAADISETAYSPLPEADSAAAEQPADADSAVIRRELSPDTQTSVESPAAAEQAADTHGAETAYQDELRESDHDHHDADDDDDDDDATGFETGYSPRIFTSIEEERQRALERERASRALVSLPTVMLALALLATGGIVWYLIQPASPATLYARISAAATGDNPAELSSVESEMDEFLNHYGGHKHAEEVRQWQARLNHYRLARGATQRARRLIERYPHNAAGRAYLEAIRLAEFDSQRAIDKLEALLALYGSLPERTDAEPAEHRANQAIVAEARQQLTRMRAELETYAAMQHATLSAALDHADRIAEDQPEQAAAMRGAAIELYGDKPWADDLVARARTALDQMEQQDAAPE